MTSNIAEQLNNALVEERLLPIVELVMFIKGIMNRCLVLPGRRQRGTMAW